MAQGYYSGNGYNNGNYNNGGYYNGGNYNGQYYNQNNMNVNYNANGQRYNNNGYYNNQNYNNNNNNENNNDNKNGKKKFIPLYIIIGCLLVVVTGMTGLLIAPIGGNNSSEETKASENIEKDNDDNQKAEESKNQKIGNEKFGHMQIPKEYVVCDNNDNTIKYCSKDKRYTITLSTTTGTNAYSYSRVLLNEVKEKGTEDAKVIQVTIDGKEAYQVYARMDTDYTLLALVIDDSNGTTHTAEINGPDGTNIVFASLETFNIN